MDRNFIDIFRIKKRMCKEQMNKPGGCVGCLLRSKGGSYTCEFNRVDSNPAEIERILLKWAEENPEPKYPTWLEWFIEQGMLPEKVEPFSDRVLKTFAECLNKPIPEDIAEKLELEAR